MTYHEEIELRMYAIKGAISVLPISLGKEFRTLEDNVRLYEHHSKHLANKHVKNFALSKINTWINETNQLVQDWTQSEGFIFEWNILNVAERQEIIEFSKSAYTSLRHKTEINVYENRMTYELNATNLIQLMGTIACDMIRDNLGIVMSTDIFQVSDREKANFDKAVQEFENKHFPNLKEPLFSNLSTCRTRYIWLLLCSQFNTKESNEKIDNLSSSQLSKEGMAHLTSLYSQCENPTPEMKKIIDKTQFYQTIEKEIAPLLDKVKLNEAIAAVPDIENKILLDKFKI